ncbi:MAG: hypothetical protein FWD60_04745 [Candidatus Azobacteroides sp.]|nr:hypothetical protein [Candidatus Azobacteroides sp.]
MNPLMFIYSHDNIFASVKQEASLLAIRRTDADGNNLFEQLVFDEAYLILFRQLFFEAQAEVTVAFSGYMKDVPTEADYFETQDFFENRDYVFYLVMPDDWNFHLFKPVDIKVKEYLIAYIMYRWLETKLPQEAATYLQRATAVLDDSRNLLEKRIKIMRRVTGFWEI